MKNLIIAATLLITSFNTFAKQNDFNHDVFAALVANSGKITLLNENNEPLSTDNQLPNMIASYLTYGYTQASEEGYLLLGSAGVSCELKAGDKNTYECDVIFINGDFAVKKDGGIYGPEAESSISFKMNVKKDSKGRAIILENKFKVFMAG